VLVIGDVMLDRYMYGEVLRISPEAPVPVVRVSGEKFVPGGAGNTANNIASLGGKPKLVGVVGADASGSLLLREMESLGIDTSGVLRDNTRPTIEKTRIVGQSQQMIRIDYEKSEYLNSDMESNLIKNIERSVSDTDIVVVSDYGKGVVTENLLHFLYEACERNGKRIIIDPKPRNSGFYRAFLITPNEKEAAEITGAANIEDMAAKFSGIASNVLITRGEKGMYLHTENGKRVVIPTEARQVFDVSGAGDTVVAVLSLVLAAGADVEDAARIANRAAGIVVGKAGTATLTIDELQNTVGSDIYGFLQETITAMKLLAEKEMPSIEKLADAIRETYVNRKKILVFGNGGSASDAQHFVGELVGRFKRERAGLPAISLNSDTTILTAISNDYGYPSVFERQVEALASPGDLVIGITTSGNSENVVRAIAKAKEMCIRTACLTGGSGGKVAVLADLAIKVPSDNTPRIQECHTAIIHVVCELLEKELYGEP